MTRDWEELITAVADAWGDLTADQKLALMQAHPDLYWAVARLAGHGRFTLHLD